MAKYDVFNGVTSSGVELYNGSMYIYSGGVAENTINQCQNVEMDHRSGKGIAENHSTQCKCAGEKCFFNTEALYDLTVKRGYNTADKGNDRAMKCERRPGKPQVFTYRNHKNAVGTGKHTLSDGKDQDSRCNDDPSIVKFVCFCHEKSPDV